MNVSPVLPSLPASGTSWASASASIAGSRAPTEGVKSTKALPVSIAASAYSALGGSTPRSASIASISARGSACAGCGSTGASVEDTLTTTMPRQVVAGAEGVEVGHDAGQRGLRLGARLAPGDPGPLLGLGRLQRARRAPRAGRRAARPRPPVARRAWPAASPRRRARRRRGRRARATGVGKRWAERDQAGRLGQPGGDRGSPGQAVVATDPRPPTSHTPTRRSTFIPSDPSTPHERSVVPLLASSTHFMLYVKTKYVSWKAKRMWRLSRVLVLLALVVGCGGSARDGAAAQRAPERFRALVFTKTTGFRHDSIPEGVRRSSGSAAATPSRWIRPPTRGGSPPAH